MLDVRVGVWSLFYIPHHPGRRRSKKSPAAANNLPVLPQKIATIPVVDLKLPEPMAAWDIDTSEFDLAQRGVPDISTEGMPASKAGS
jgi:hypothetical protein